MTLEEGYSRSVHLGKRPGSQKARLSFSLTQLFFNTVDDEYNTIFAKLTKKKIIWGYEEDYSQSDFESLGMNNNFP